MAEYTSKIEDKLRGYRRALIDQGKQVSLIAYDPARELYVFNTIEDFTGTPVND